MSRRPDGRCRPRTGGWPRTARAPWRTAAGREHAPLAQEGVPRVECRQHLGNRRGDVGRGRQRGAGGPIQLCECGTGRASAAADLSAQELAVHLAHHGEGQGRLAEPLDPIPQRGDAGADLAEMIAGHLSAGGADLVQQQVREAHVGSLDARRAERLLPLERGVQQLWVGQLTLDAAQLTEGVVGTRQRHDELAVVRQPRRQGRRHEGRVPFRRGDDRPASGAWNSLGSMALSSTWRWSPAAQDTRQRPWARPPFLPLRGAAASPRKEEAHRRRAVGLLVPLRLARPETASRAVERQIRRSLRAAPRGRRR